MVDKVQVKKDIKKVLIDTGVSVRELARRLEKSQPTLSAQINGATFRYVDLVNILDLLGYDVVWVKRHNGENKNDWGTEKPSDEKA